MTKQEIDHERVANFACGWDDGVRDANRNTGRAVSHEDRDYAFGYIAGRHGQIDLKRVETYDQAKEIWDALPVPTVTPHTSGIYWEESLK